MNTIYKAQARPYVLDPFDLPYSKGYMFPKGANKVSNNNVNFTANQKAELLPSNLIRQKTEKLRQLTSQLQPQNKTGNQLNTLI